VDAITKKTSATENDTEIILCTAIEAIVSGDKVTLAGFGSFEKRDRKARGGRNPKLGETMQVSATSMPAFGAGKRFKEKVTEQ
jgi:DNA-binding protein HU-beta